MPTTAEAVSAIRHHHCAMQAELSARTDALIEAVADGRAYATALGRLSAYVAGEVLPHAAAEEHVLYKAGAQGAATLLVQAMREEHEVLARLARELANVATPLAAATTAASLRTLFDAHLTKENDLLVPALVEYGVDLGRLLVGMHELLGPQVGAA